MSEVTFGDPPTEGRGGDPVAGLKMCTECGRDVKRLIRKKCGACYERQRRGSPARWAPLDPEIAALLLLVPRTSQTFAQRVFHYVDASGDCWEWTGTLNDDGYGVIGRGVRGSGNIQAHCAVWELLVGEIPADLNYDHLCRNHSCVNPDHGEIVPPGVNTLRGYGRSRYWSEAETCDYGHPLDGIRNRNGCIHRYCKTCNRLRMRVAARAA